MTVTEAEAVLVVSAWLVAVTVTLVLALTVGAVKSPELEIEPAEEVQMTAALEFPVSVAVNCCVPPEATIAADGETLTETLGVPHVPGLRLLDKPLSTLPDPMSLDAVTLMAAVNPGPKVLLLMQALALPFAINMPVEPGPLIVAL